MSKKLSHGTHRPSSCCVICHIEALSEHPDLRTGPNSFLREYPLRVNTKGSRAIEVASSVSRNTRSMIRDSYL